MKLLLHDVRLPLAHFDLQITTELSGPVTGIFGPSGAGKTSLLDTVAGLRLPRTGRIALDDVLFDDTQAGIHIAARHRRIGYVPQENALFPHMSVTQNIRYGAAGDALIDRVVDVLEIDHLLGRGVKSLSGGEQKRVAVARALVTSPRLLLLDEPLAGLDRPLHGRILMFLKRIRDDFRVPMLYVTHDSAELAEIAEETVVLDRGRIVAVGRTSEVIAAT
jgi:molybdate transport system ATP-binding protein